VVSTELEERDPTNGVDVEDVPSAAWGWSKENHKAIHIGGIIAAAFLLAMLRGNHVGRVEDVFLVVFALLVLAVVARDWWKRRRGWYR
jgi:hypothetical protein